MNNRRKVALLVGGKSAEHEISLISGLNIARAIDKERFDLIIIGVNKKGKWFLQDEAAYLQISEDPKQVKLPESERSLGILPGEGSEKLFDFSNGTFIESPNIVFPILHGPYGEDGTMQGLLRQMDLPFVGPGVLGSSVGMDKEVVKRLLDEANVPNAKFIVLHKHEVVPEFAEVEAELKLPMFVKPANMGSSVGISKVEKEADFAAAIQLAFRFDTKLLIESFVDGREIECAVLGNENPRASVPGEIIPENDFYSYEAKYIDEKGAKLEAPARDLSDALVERIQAEAVRVFQLLECEGLSRVDFFLTEDESLFVNEINTLPGFTQISMYPRLWGLSGIPYTELITELLELAVSRHNNIPS